MDEKQHQELIDVLWSIANNLQELNDTLSTNIDEQRLNYGPENPEKILPSI